MATRYWIILVTIGVAFGAVFACNEILLRQYGPLSVSMLRVGLGALGCWTWVVATGRRVDLSVGMLASTTVFGIFQYASPFAVLPLAQQHIASSTAGIANAMTPIATVIISHHWRGGERATLTRFLGVVLGIVGITLLMAPGAGTGTNDPVYILLAVAAPVCYGIALNLVRSLRAVDPVVMTACAMTGGSLVIAPLALSLEGMPVVPDGASVAAFALIGFGLTTVTFLVMYAILPKVGATNVTLVTFVAPVSGAAIGTIVFGEPIGPELVASMVFILAALVVIDGRLPRLFARLFRTAAPA